MVRILPSVVFSALLLGCGPSADRSGSASAAPETGPVVDPAGIATRAPLVSRLLIVALDGATWDLLDPVLEAGEAPNLARLVAEGARADLATLEPTLSPAIWTTIATGFTPDQHGILGFEGVPGQSMTTLPNATMRQRKTYWNVLSDFGITSGTLGWWASWPADPMSDGSFLVSDRVPYTRMEAAIHRAPLDAGDIVPAELADVVAPLVQKPDAIDAAVVSRFLHLDGKAERERFLSEDYRMGSFLPEFKFAYQSDLSTVRMARAAFDRMPVDVLSVYLTGIDTVSHLYWHFAFPEQFPDFEFPAADLARFGDVIRLYYGQVDAWIGELLETVGDGTTVLVVSDHGFGGTGRLPWSGGHGRITPGAPIAPAGILLLSGPGAARGVRLPRAHVLDLAPTILHLMGLPAAQDQVGRVLTAALAPGSPEELPRVPTFEDVGSIRHPGRTADAAGDAQRMERLRALGYIQ
jgi:Type I phosphodiesterase / nucleotide pyrophosphatase